MTKRTLGISLYPDHSDFKTDAAYLKTAAKYGFSRIFMSMLEVSEGKDVVAAKYRKLISVANHLGFTTTLDVAPSLFKQLGISYQDLSFFAELGAAGIRLDDGFDGHQEALLSYNPQRLNLELNMSKDVDYLPNILSYAANRPFISGCHNFYPQRGTGLPLDFFTACSKRFKKYGIDTAAFVTAKNSTIGPWDINDGLPTLEMHRDLPIAVQAQHLFATNLIDSVIIGNAYASEAELAAVGALDRYQLQLAVRLDPAITDLERAIVFDNQHERRGDITDLVVRSTSVRKLYRDDNPVSGASHDFQRGDVVIGNNQFGKYQNELQIVLEPHHDDRKNKVATVVPEELLLLDYLGPWTKFKFKLAQA